MFEYRVAGDSWSQNGALSGDAWTLSALQPLAPGALTPFSYSVLAELVSRAWYEHYAALGFEPTPRVQVVRRHRGRAYFNLTKSARLEAEHGAVSPPVLRINDQNVVVCPWEKPGFLGSLRSGRVRKRMAGRVTALDKEFADILAHAENWYVKTGELKWSQADILQVMEEIERVGMKSFAAYLAARRQLEQAYNRLLVLTADAVPFPRNVNLINHAVCDVDGLLEGGLVQDLIHLADTVTQDASAQGWLEAGSYANWTDMLAGPSATAVEAFLARYGHRTAGEGELANPRWRDDPAPIFAALRTYITHGTRRPAALPAKPHAEKVIAAAGQHAEEVPGLIEAVRQASQLQSKALNAVALILAGTRRWALAAGREATADRRLDAAHDVFFYELEEIKQMMTGEWNVSAMEAIRATAAERRDTYAADLKQLPGSLLIGDMEADSAVAGLPATEGHASGPLRRHDQPRPPACNGALIGTTQLDSGWSILLPIAKGLIAACGTPLDPLIAVGRLWHTPIMVDIGPRYVDLVDGAHTVLDVEEIVLDQ